MAKQGTGSDMTVSKAHRVQNGSRFHFHEVAQLAHVTKKFTTSAL